MKTGLLRKWAVAGIAMLMLITLVSGIGQAAGNAGNVTINVEVTITYDANYNGSSGYMRDNHSRGKSYKVKDNPYKRNGYDFDGWNTQPDGRGTSYAAGQVIVSVEVNITLYAQWRPVRQRTVDIKYKPNYPRGSEPKDVTDTVAQGSDYQIRYNLNNSVFAPPANDYVFAGWNTHPNGKGTSYTVGDVIKANADLTLFAQWTRLQKYTVTYKSNYPHGFSQVEKQDENILQGDAYQIKYNINNSFMPLPANDYRFAGWNTQANGRGTKYEEGQIIPAMSAHLTLYAQWTQLKKFTVTYKANYPHGAWPVPSDQKDANLIQGDYYQIRYNINDSFIAAPAGYTFAGWNTRSDGRGTAYDVGLVITVSENLTLYAQWTRSTTTPTPRPTTTTRPTTAPTLTVTYMSNYPAGFRQADKKDENLVPGDYYQIKYNINDSFMPPPANDYVFTGWNTQANGRGKGYEVGLVITVTENLTLYAQWTRLLKFTVTYNSNYPATAGVRQVEKKDENLIQGDYYQIKYNINDSFIAAPAGYKFTGWNTQANGRGKVYEVGLVITVSENLTLYAQWR